MIVGEVKDQSVAVADQSNAHHGRLGLEVRPLTPAEQQQAGVAGGLRVEGVTGPAARAGIQEGDVILSLNGTPVKNADQLRGLTAKAAKNVAVLIQRGDARIFVPIDLG